MNRIVLCIPVCLLSLCAWVFAEADSKSGRKLPFVPAESLPFYDDFTPLGAKSDPWLRVSGHWQMCPIA